jgi:hypothetical protein
MQRRATVVDYIRAHHAKVGLAFAYWPGVEATATGWAAAETMLQEHYEAAEEDGNKLRLKLAGSSQ